MNDSLPADRCRTCSVHQVLGICWHKGHSRQNVQGKCPGVCICQRGICQAHHQFHHKSPPVTHTHTTQSDTRSNTDQYHVPQCYFFRFSLRQQLVDNVLEQEDTKKSRGDKRTSKRRRGAQAGTKLEGLFSICCSEVLLELLTKFRSTVQHFDSRNTIE